MHKGNGNYMDYEEEEFYCSVLSKCNTFSTKKDVVYTIKCTASMCRPDKG